MRTPPEYKGRHQLKYRGHTCLNCSYNLDLSDKYCPQCSQINSIKKITFKDLILEFFGSIISYDSRFRQTIGSLLFKPGKISTEYIAGKRMRYANPFRFFLSVAIIYVFIIGITSGFSDLDRSKNNNKSTLQSVLLNEKVYDQLSISTKGKDINGKALDSIINNAVEKKNKPILNRPKAYFDSISKLPTRFNRFFAKVNFFEAHLKNDSFYAYREAVDSLGITHTFENKISFNTAKSFYKVESQPGSFLDMVISRTPFFIFFFLPVFAIFIWLIYSKKKYNYMDHLVFSFHTQTTFIILITIAFIIDYFLDLSAISIALILFLFYLYKAMRNFYKQSRFKTIVKFTILNSFFFILAVIALTILFLASAITY